jgi:hypothetical protein
MAKKKINNIVRFERTISAVTTAFKGILDAELDIDEGDFVPDFVEGDLYPTGKDNVGTPGRFPCTGAINMEDIAQFLTLLTGAVGTNIKIIGKQAGSAGNQLFTVLNPLFTSGSLSLSRQRDARAALQLIAYSADGTVHPFSVDDSADTTAPTTDKVKVNNIVSVTHAAVPSPGILDVTINVTRGTFAPDHDEGELYPIGADLAGVGDSEYPVTGTVRCESMDAIGFVGDGPASLVTVAKAAQGEDNLTITALNAQFRRARGQVRRRQDGSVDMDFVCHASTGSALPLTIA